MAVEGEPTPGRGRWLAPLVPIGLTVAVLAGSRCGGPREPEGPDLDPPTARWATVEELRAGVEAPRHPSDGGGRAWLERDGDGPAARAGRPGSWTIVFEAGPLGIAEGGALYLQVDPFWDWDTPQVEYPEARGYTTVETDADGLRLEAATLNETTLILVVLGRALEEGERVRLVYGAGPLGARADSYRDRGTHLWIAVDGDGDGVRRVLADSPTLDVESGPAARLVLSLPSTARPGEEVRLTVALLDPRGSAGVEFEGRVELLGRSAGLELPESVDFAGWEGARRTVWARVLEPGVYQVDACALGTGRGPAEDLCGSSNPMLVHDAAPRLLWGDVHGHSNLSDGTGTPDDYFDYAREVAGLDVVALTDHDHWGVRFLDENPEIWQHIVEVTARHHEPGRFVTLLGYEWTSWIHGHRHVLYFNDRGRLLSSVDPATETPAQLWDALRGEDALTFAHHSAGGPIATNWSFPPDPVLEPVTEVTSVHGVSEADDAPGRIYAPRKGNFARDALDRGYRLGFIGSGDGHDGHPGLTHLATGQGGLAGIFAEEATRAGVLEAFRARRVYATNGPRIFLNARLEGHAMGSDLPAASLGAVAKLVVRGLGTGPIETVELVRSGAVVEGVDCGGVTSFNWTFELEGLAPGEYVYVRLQQGDRGQAWSSPFFIR